MHRSTTSALLLTWLIWGSTFLAIHVAVASMPPLLMMGSRFIAAGLVAAVIGTFLARRSGAVDEHGRALRPSRRALRDNALIGVGLVTVGMGAAGWAVTRLDTGVAALLVATAPLWIALLSAITQRRAPLPLVAFGLAVGIAGVGILVAPGGSGSSHVDVTGALVVVLANAAWAAASLFAPRAASSGHVVLDSAVQMLVGGTVLLAAGTAVGELGSLTTAALTPAALASWGYLVVAGSLGGFLAYAWLLDTVSASLASTHAFINPLVAVALGAVALGEHVGARTFVSGAAVIIAVIALIEAERRDGATVVADIPAAPARAAAVARTASARRRRSASMGRSLGGVVLPRHGRAAGGWSPAPTPSFAARRTERPWVATDGMDALAIDAAFEGRR